ncbi:STT3 domain-containing protein [uncultured Campylobacter sp.]|uniref:STT3 domain-containing protein n=1 Tax=uncultured Campylobacter sp. TaxID=218934 RepID=UPI00262C9309|nr:STT3 domain-containing protein [uncultured Campylobacter sp.]
MQKFRITNGECSRMDIFLIMTLVYIFGVACRFFWIYWASGIEQFSFDGELIMTTNDAFANAEGARDMIAGFHQPGDLSPYGASIPTLAFLLSKILPVSLNSIAIYMSVFFAPLVAVPIILIAREYKILGAGIIAALLACVLPGYYVRTLGGYFDSDMLNVAMPLLTLWALIRLIGRSEQSSFALPAIFTVIYDWWYPSSYSLNMAIIVIFLIYTLISNRHNEENYKAIILMVVAVINFGAYYEGETIIVNYILLFKTSLIALLYFLMIKIPSHKSKKVLWILGVIVVIMFIIFGGLVPIITEINVYILKNAGKGDIFHFYGVRNTVNEVANANFMKFVLESSGHLFIFICAVGGLALLLIKFRSFILTLPMIALGVLALFGGTRFTMYATPMIALGFAYFIYFTLNYFEIRTWLRSTLLAILTCLALMPSIDFIYKFRVAPTLTKDSIMPLAELKNKASREDYVLSWWDYGYLIRYYSDVKVVADPGGRQAGEYTFMSAFSFNKDEVSSANMARLNVEYIQKLQGKKFDPKLEDKFKLNLYQIQKDYGEADINKFLSSLSDKNFKLPQKTRDIYYYFVPKMIDILPNIWKFTSIDIASGEKFKEPLAYVGYDIQIGKDGKSIILGEGVELPSVKPEYVVHNGEKLSINSYYQVGEVNGELKKISKQIDTKSNIYVIFLPNYQRILILDKKVFESAFIQLFVLENYDKDLFEPVYLSNSARIYKLLR